jgi:hypothetical protein
MCCSIRIRSVYCCDYLRHVRVTLGTDSHSQQAVTYIQRPIHDWI